MVCVPLLYFIVRRIWRCQRGNPNPYIEEQTTQWPKEKGQRTKNDLHSIHICTYKTKDRVTRNPLRIEGELMCSGRVNSSCSTSDTRPVNLVTNPVISHEWGKNRKVFTTSCPSFFDLRLSDYHVYPQKYLSTFIRCLLFVDILLASLICLFPIHYWNNTLTFRYWRVSCTRQKKCFYLCTPDYFYCHWFIFFYIFMFFTPSTFQTGS